MNNAAEVGYTTGWVRSGCVHTLCPAGRFDWTRRDARELRDVLNALELSDAECRQVDPDDRYVPEISHPPSTMRGLSCPTCGPQQFVTMFRPDLDRGTCRAGWYCASCGGAEYVAGRNRDADALMSTFTAWFDSQDRPPDAIGVAAYFRARLARRDW